MSCGIFWSLCLSATFVTSSKAPAATSWANSPFSMPTRPICCSPPAFASAEMRLRITALWSVTKSTEAPWYAARIFLRMFSCSVTGLNCVEAKTKGFPWSAPVPPPDGVPVVEHAVTRIAAAAANANARALIPRMCVPPRLDRFRVTLDVTEHDLQNFGWSPERRKSAPRVVHGNFEARQAAENDPAAQCELQRSCAQRSGIEARVQIPDLAGADLDAIVVKLLAETKARRVSLVEPDRHDRAPPPH